MVTASGSAGSGTHAAGGAVLHCSPVFDVRVLPEVAHVPLGQDLELLALQLFLRLGALRVVADD